MASLSVRAIGPRTDIGEGYVTLGAGNRARVDRSRAGDAVDAGEQIGPNTGAAIYRALTGHDPAGAAVLSLAIEDARTDADHLLYGSVPGAMGKAIEDAGRSAAVIANADGGPPTGVDQLHREAALAMMDAEGRVGGGTVSRDLTVVDPAAPGGRRMDPAAVLDAFDAAWSGPDASDAVLVEMSDLERADRNGLPLTGPERAAGLASPLAAGRRDARAAAAAGRPPARPGHRRQPGRARRLRPADGVRAGGAGGRARPGPQRHHPPPPAT